jgi:LDH2 family malate/lactate/ureidoglycolate dehydrogenase
MQKRRRRYFRRDESSPLLPDSNEIRLPGERAYASLKERTAHGVPMPEAVVRDLNALAAECGVAPLSSS